MDDQELLQKVGENIARIRKERNMRQIDLADKCEMEDTNIIRIEKGRTNPTTLTLHKIAKALNVNIKELFD